MRRSLFSTAVLVTALLSARQACGGSPNSENPAHQRPQDEASSPDGRIGSVKSHMVLYDLDAEPILVAEDDLVAFARNNTHHLDNFMDLSLFPSLPTLPLKPHPLVPTNFPSEPSQRELVERMIEVARPVAAKNMVDLLEHYQTYHTRYYRTQTGIDAALWLSEQIIAVAERGQSRGFPVEAKAFSHANWEQVSVVARIPGSTAEPVTWVIGAHLDSLGSGSSGRAPGADDDGSGTATVLEILRAVIESDYRPQHTLEFHFYSAEEPGMLGSQDIAQIYRDSGIPVGAYGNFDMTAFAWAGEDSYAGLITECSTPSLNSFIKMLFDEYLDINITDTSCRYICGDHCSWHRRAGVPAAFPFESPFGRHNRHIHTPQDLVDKLDFERYGFEWVKLGLAFIAELGEYTSF